MATKRRMGISARGRDRRLTDIMHAPRERWSHGADYDVIEVDLGLVQARRVQIVTGPVQALLRSGKITTVEVAAASRWVADYERGMRSSYCDPATAGIRAPGGSNSGPELRLLGGIAAAERRQQVREAVGAEGEALLVQHVHLGLSVRAVAGDGGAARAKAADALADILRALADHYGEIDRWSRDGVVQPKVAGAANGNTRAETMAA